MSTSELQSFKLMQNSAELQTVKARLHEIFSEIERASAQRSGPFTRFIFSAQLIMAVYYRLAATSSEAGIRNANILTYPAKKQDLIKLQFFS